MVKTHYGKFGGQYIPETLMPVLHELAAAYGSAKNDPEFQRELHELLTGYVGRESPLYFARRLSEYCNGARIFLRFTKDS